MSKTITFRNGDAAIDIKKNIYNSEYRKIIIDGVQLSDKESNELYQPFLNGKMKSVTLNNVQFGNQGNSKFSIIVSALYENKNVVKWKISNINLENNSVTSYIRSAIKNDTLKELLLVNITCGDGMAFEQTFDNVSQNNSLERLEVDLPGMSVNSRKNLIKSIKDNKTIHHVVLGAQVINYNGNKEKLPEELVELMRADKLQTFSCEFSPNSKSQMHEFIHLIASTKNLQKCKIITDSDSLTMTEAKLLSCAQKKSGVNKITIKTPNTEWMSLDVYIKHLDTQLPAKEDKDITLDSIYDYLHSELGHMEKGSTEKFLVQKKLELIKGYIDNGKGADNIVDEIEKIIKSHPTVGTEDSVIYQDLSQLYSSANKQKSNDYELKAKIRDFTNKLKASNAENNALLLPLQKEIVSTLFNIIDLDINQDLQKAVESVFKILHFNPGICNKIGSENIAEFFADQGITEFALSYLPGNYNNHYEMPIKDEGFIEFLNNKKALVVAAAEPNAGDILGIVQPDVKGEGIELGGAIGEVKDDVDAAG